MNRLDRTNLRSLAWIASVAILLSLLTRLAAAEEPFQVEVNILSAKITADGKQIGTVKRETKLTAHEAKPDGYLVDVPGAHPPQQGWIAKDEVHRVPPKLTADQQARFAEALQLYKEYETAYAKGKLRDSRLLAEQIVSICRDSLGEKHASTAASIHNLGRVAANMGDYPAARKYFEQALAIRRELLGEQHAETAASIVGLGSVARDTGDYFAARKLFEQALAIQRNVFGEKNSETALTLNNLGVVAINKGDYRAARSYFEQALAIRREVLGEKHVYIGASLNNLGVLVGDMGDYPAAREYLEQALVIRREVLGEKHPDTASTLSNLGNVAAHLADYPAARKCFEKALAIEREVLGEKHRDTAATLGNLGYMARLMGDFPAARKYYQQVLAICREVLGEKHPDTAAALNSLGTVASAMGDYTAAQTYFARGLAIRRDVLGEKHPDTADSIIGIGTVALDTKDYSAAREYFAQALAIQRDVLGEKHVRTAGSLNNLGAVAYETGDYAAARKYHEQVLAINREVLGKKHPDTARSLNNLGGVANAMGEYPAARKYFEQALAIYREILGENHPDTARSQFNVAITDAASGDWPEAGDSMEKSRRIARRCAIRILPALSETEQITFRRNTDDMQFYSSLSLGLIRRDDPRVASASASWLLNGKGVVEEVLSQNSRLARDTSDPAAREALGKLTAIRQQLARSSQSTPLANQLDDWRRQVAELEGLEQDSARKLAALGAHVDLADPWVSLGDLRSKLPADGWLVDIVLLPVRNFQAKGGNPAWQPARYAAWLIPPTGKGEVRIVDLGEAEKIDAVVQLVRLSLERTHAEEEVQEPLAALAKLVFAPLAPHLGKTDRLIISPDAALWLVPWGALPLADGRYAIEKYKISYVVSGRDLVNRTDGGKKRVLSPSVVFANPDYNLDSDAALANTQTILNGGSKIAAATDPGNVKLDEFAALSETRRSATGFGKVKPLPGTAIEARAIAPFLKSYTKVEPISYVDKDALEGVFKQVHSPRVAVLSTHGFFLPKQEVPLDDKLNSLGLIGEDRKRPLLDKDNKPIENPLLRCGLLLAGCNRRDEIKADAGDNVDDGVLTGLEIVGTDLRGTELVVLSACETGLGDIRIGEGVAGLRQAFQLAGAKAVVSTLWRIPDQETTWLMTRFWENLAKGQSKADALRDAQLFILYHRDELQEAAAKGNQSELDKLLATRSVDFDNPVKLPNSGKTSPPTAATSHRAHPLYWAAFTLTGE
jgi:CHAT domain-containing protein/tetratricopeptide (TPR) repeat protein